jgi:hypothetical protein
VYIEKKVLIVTDSGEQLESAAQSIKNCLRDWSVKICPVQTFAGTDLLPARIFFLGCNTPDPQSFASLKEMLSHINLVSRKCGIFSANRESLDYLGGILKDCEAELGEPLLITNGNDNSAIEEWLKGITG